MGCQCAKSPDTTNMHLESNSPPPKIDISEVLFIELNLVKN